MAERNGGINGFYGAWDLRIAKKFKVYKSQYLELSAHLFNVENLLNKTWGASQNLGKQNIYTLRTFDDATNTYNYDVNGNIGQINPGGNPWQLQLGIRYGF